MEPPPSTEACLPREQRVCQENRVCRGLSPGGLGGQWAPAPPLRDPPEGGVGLEALGHPLWGLREGRQVRRLQGSEPAFLGRILASVGPGVRRPSRESGGCAWRWRMAVSPDLKRAAPGNPSIFCLQVPDGAPESGRPEDTVSRWTWPECQKRTQIRGHHVRALARVTAAKRGAGPLSRRGSRSFCDWDSSGSSAEPCWSLNNEGSAYPVCRSHAPSSARPQGIFCVQCDMGRTAPESEKEKQIHDIDHM